MKPGSVVVAFDSTTLAMEYEYRAGEEGRPGRLIPLPPQIDASCGLCWLYPDEPQYEKWKAGGEDAYLCVGENPNRFRRMKDGEE